MKVTVISKQDAQELLYRGKESLRQEVGRWERAEAEGREPPKNCSGDMICYRQMGKQAMVYSFSGMGAQELEYIGIPLIRDLCRTFPSLAAVILEPPDGGWEEDKEALDIIRGCSCFYHRFRQDTVPAAQILIGVYNKEVQERLDPMALIRAMAKA